MIWRLVITPKVERSIQVLSPQTKRYVRAALEELKRNPLSGKALHDELAGLYSYRMNRFRIVYRLEHHTITVVVVGVGRRESIYEELIAELD